MERYCHWEWGAGGRGSLGLTGLLGTPPFQQATGPQSTVAEMQVQHVGACMVHLALAGRCRAKWGMISYCRRDNKGVAGREVRLRHLCSEACRRHCCYNPKRKWKREKALSLLPSSPFHSGLPFFRSPNWKPCVKSGNYKTASHPGHKSFEWCA